MGDWTDIAGQPIHVGDLVLKTRIDAGAPATATTGTVVGFGRTRVYVQWGYWAYGEAMPYHCPRPTSLRVLEKAEQGATSG